MQNNSERMAGCVVAVHHNHLKHTLPGIPSGRVWPRAADTQTPSNYAWIFRKKLKNKPWLRADRTIRESHTTSSAHTHWVAQVVYVCTGLCAQVFVLSFPRCPANQCDKTLRAIAQLWAAGPRALCGCRPLGIRLRAQRACWSQGPGGRRPQREPRGAVAQGALGPTPPVSPRAQGP